MGVFACSSRAMISYCVAIPDRCGSYGPTYGYEVRGTNYLSLTYVRWHKELLNVNTEIHAVLIIYQVRNRVHTTSLILLLSVLVHCCTRVHLSYVSSTAVLVLAVLVPAVLVPAVLVPALIVRVRTYTQQERKIFLQRLCCVGYLHNHTRGIYPYVPQLP